jgi:hypothetical protein
MVSIPVRFATLPSGLNPLELFDQNFAALVAAINAGVVSVNGQVGVVVLDAADVGAVAAIAPGANITVDSTDPQNPIVSATGVVTSVSVAAANGFAGSSSGGATPALTLETTVTAPALAGNGTAISAATTTGSGSTVVLAGDPTLTLLNATGLPLTTGVTGVLPTANGGEANVATRTNLANLDTTKNTVAYLSEAGRQGWFQWSSANLSAQVTLDTQQGVYVAPSSDPTGASGAWVRIYSGSLNPVWFGADPTNTNDSRVAYLAAAALGGDIEFPPGTFKFTSSADVTLPNSRYGFRVRGAGKDQTVIDFPSSNATVGISFTYTNFANSVVVEDLTLTTGKVGTGNAITLFASAIGGPSFVSPSTIIDNVSMRGNDGALQTNYFAVGILINQVSSVNVLNCYVAGPSAYNGIGVQWQGAAANFAIVLNIQSSQFRNMNAGLYINGYAQGLSVLDTNFSGIYGIYQASGALSLAELNVANCQFGPMTGFGIVLQSGCLGACIMNNFFDITGSGATGIVVSGDAALSLVFSIIGNHFECGTQTNSTGVYVDAMSLAAVVGNGVISGNQFWNLGLGIALTSGSRNVSVADNTYGSPFGGSAFITNAGTGNVIESNIGYNPVGVTAAVTVGASPATITAGASPETHYIRQSATNTATVAIDGNTIATLVNASTYYTVELPPNTSYVVTWTTTAPTYTKYVH